MYRTRVYRLLDCYWNPGNLYSSTLLANTPDELDCHPDGHEEDADHDDDEDDDDDDDGEEEDDED